jgi:hypothetical protein
MSAQAYPLDWPDHIQRSTRRENGRFSTTLTAAVNNVQESLRRFGSDSNKAVSEVTISSNVTLGVNKPSDPGVAVWFKWDGMSVCIPVDRYSKPEANLQAIHHIIEARRVELRHGTLQLVKASFSGFKALPSPPGQAPKKPWWEVLQIRPDSDRATIEESYRILAKKAHPDAGGSADAMADLNRAKQEALASA